MAKLPRLNLRFPLIYYLKHRHIGNVKPVVKGKYPVDKHHRPRFVFKNREEINHDQKIEVRNYENLSVTSLFVLFKTLLNK